MTTVLWGNVDGAVFGGGANGFVASPLVAALAGVGVGVGFVLAVASWRGVRPWADRQRPVGVRVLSRPRAVGAVAVAAITFVATQLVVVALAVAAVVLLWPKLFGGAAHEQAVIARLEALAVWAEALRDTMATGSGLVEALRATSRRPPQELAFALTELATNLDNREPVEWSLRRLADAVDDPVGDQVIAALIMNARVQGRQLRAVLASLAESTRKTVQSRREVAADRRTVRRGVHIIMVVIGVMVLGMALFAPDYAQAYRTVMGQMVMGVALGLFAAGFLVIRQLAVMCAPARFLREEK